eukprot:gi/632969374/ref/XP_007901053.1/ PREDICTED: protein transport protein Sec16A isoform X2 [Callorhinchus milii]
MQPPPRSSPGAGGAAGPPPSGGAPNAYRRNSPFRRSNTPMSAPPASVPPMTDPLGHGRLRPPGNGHSGQSAALPNPAKAGPLPPGQPPPVFPVPFPNRQDGNRLPHQFTNALHSAPAPFPGQSNAAESGTPPYQPNSLVAPLPLMPQFNSGGQFSPAPPAHNTEAGHSLAPELSYFHTGAGLENSYAGLALGPAPFQSRAPYAQEPARDPMAYPPPAPGPPAFPQQNAAQWAPAQGSRPPSVQNYFQPSDPQTQSFNSYSVSQPHPPSSSPAHLPSPHNLVPADQHQPPSQEPFASAVAVVDPNGHRLPGFHSGPQPSEAFIPQEHHGLKPNLGSAEAWLSGPRNEPFQPQAAAEAGYQSNAVSWGERLEDRQQLAAQPADSMLPVDTESGTISMFFKGDEVENEETLRTERTDSLAADSFQPSSVPFFKPYPLPNSAQPNIHTQRQPSQAPSAEQSSFLPNATGQYDNYLPGSTELGANPNAGTGGSRSQRDERLQFENNENLDFIQNQEVLPSEPDRAQIRENIARFQPIPGLGSQAQPAGESREGVPNLEKPNLAPHPRPLRSDSINSNHSSGSSSRRALAPAPPPPSTFIQQESGKGAPDSSAHFFEQIDSSPQGGEGLYHTQTPQPPTPSPPKPTGNFQASANSSFEPVRSHGQLAFKPPEVDQAKMVMELNRERRPGPPRPAGHMDASPGNLEQPPDNLENLFLPQPCPELGGAEQLAQTHPPPRTGSETPEKRPSSRVNNVRVKCDSPAATLWAQSELPSFCGGVVLAPAAPAVHVAVREPGAEASLQHEGSLEGLGQRFLAPALGIPGPGPHPGSENLENPPLVVEDPALKSQASSSYATLLVPSATEALPSQPVLLAQPLQSYTSTLANPSAPSPSQPLRNQIEGEKVVGFIPSSLGIGAVPPVPQGPLSNPSLHPPHPHVNPTHNSVRTSGVLPPDPSPLNLTADSRASIRLPAEGLPEIPAASPPLSQAPGPGRSVAVAASNYQFAPGKNATNQPYNRPEASVNCELLDFTVPRTLPNEPSASTNATDVLSLPSTAVIAPQPAVLQSYPQGVQANDKPGFYLQVTKDVQQSPTAVTGQHTAPLPSAQATTTDAGQPVLAGSLLPSAGYGPPGSGLPQTVLQAPTLAQTPPANVARPPSQPDMQQPPPARTPQQVYCAPQQHAYNYGYNYPDYSADTRQPYPGSYPVYPPQEPRGSQQMPYPAVDNRSGQPYYQDDQYRMYDPRYPRYDQGNAGYKEAERSQYTDQERERPSRPSSRASQCSDRPSSRQGYPEDYYSWRNSRAGYGAYYADYYRRPHDYTDLSHWERFDSAAPAAYDPRYQDYWYYNNYQRREPYYHDPYGGRRNGYESQWQYDPRYDASFDDDYDRPQEIYQDEFDRRSVHSEHSLPSSRSTRSRRSSFSAHSQQSQVYKSQQDLTATREAPGQPAPVDYTYAQYQDHTTLMQGYQDSTAVMQGYPDYQYGYPAETGWQPVEKAPPRPVTPEKFMIPHVCARFSPGGQLLKVLPNLPSEGQPALVELHSLETMLQHLPEQEELRNFPGPLVKEETHKVDVINFAQNKGTECLRNEELLDKESANLLWDLMVLLCRQNGTVIGTDIAELLLREHRSVWLPGKSPNEANLIDFNNELVPRAEDESCTTQLSLLTDSFMEGTSSSTENPSKETERFRELLLFGRKKDALESAMKHGLWGHALLLASKMDNRTHAKVMTRFANSLPINDPLQTVYQLMSGRMPAAATCCGEEKWGHWRPHLAMVLSNLSNGLELNRRTMTTMGDTLATKGLLEAAHFCYLMAQVGFGVYTRKSTKLVLIGSNHSWSFLKFASSEAIQRTETYEYAQALGSQPSFLPNFQVFKFIYACRLAEMGLTAQAFHYCEVIAKTMLKNALYYSPVLYSQLVQVSSQLRFFDPQLREKSEQELNMEPEWMVHLKLLDQQMKEGTFLYSSERAATPHQYGSSTPSSEYDHGSQLDGAMAGLPEGGSGTDNPLMTSFVPSAGGPSVQLVPPAPQAILDGTTVAPVPQLPVAPPPQMTVDGNIPMYFPLQASTAPQVPGFPGQSLNSAFRQPYELEKEPVYMGTAGPPPPGLPAEPLQTVPEQVANPEFKPNTQISPKRQSFSDTGQIDFHNHMAKMPYGRRSRTTSESSTHSGGRERRSSLVRQPSLPAQDSAAPRATEVKEPRREAETKKSKGGWLSWLRPNRKPEAHLPDDKNKSIVWDEKQQRWVNLNEPAEEESKPPPPPPSFPKPTQSLPMAGPPGGPPSVNMFSKKAGTRARYVDVLNPSGTRPGGNVPPPIDLFAPLAPMAIPANLFMPAPGEGHPIPDASMADSGQPADNNNFGVDTQPLPNSGTDGSAPVPDGLQFGEVGVCVCCNQPRSLVRADLNSECESVRVLSFHGHNAFYPVLCYRATCVCDGAEKCKEQSSDARSWHRVAEKR